LRGDGTLLFTPKQVFLPLAATCSGGIAIILVLARDPTVAYAAAGAWAAASLISLLLATVWGRRDGRAAIRTIAVGVLGASATLPGWFFGPSSAYAGIVAVLLLFAGVVLGGRDTPFPTSGAWAVFAGLVAGQATVATLVLTGRLRDVSLLPMLPAGAVVWHHIAAHVTVLAVDVAAFAIGRTLHRRYWALSEELDVSTRAVARREALLDEARAEYRRTFALGREGVFAGHTVGRYQLGDLIGRGGAGEVYSARDVVDGAPAAVKLLRADKLADAARVRGFLDEATLLTRIESPHVVRTRHVGGNAELPYIAMERLDGDTLAQLIEKRGRLDRSRLRALIEGGTAALAATHAAGATHGDVAPANLMLVGETWKLIDFGIGAGLGTPRFVAPERLAGGVATPRSDLYGLAGCLYLAITGNEPFAGVPVAALPALAARELPMDPRLGAEVSNEVSDVLALALSPERFGDAAELRAALIAALDGTIDDALRDRLTASWSVAPPPARPSFTDVMPRHPTTDVVTVVPPSAPHNSSPDLDWLMSPATMTSETTAGTAWRGAFADRMRLQSAYVMIACVVGAGLILAIAPTRWMLGVALTTIGAAAAVVAIEQRVKKEWPWLIVAALAIGPAYVFGLHSGFAAVLVVVLFIECSFTASAGGYTGRGYTLGAVLITHTACFVLIHAGILSDTGVTPILHHDPAWSGWVVEALVLSVFVTAFAIGKITQQRYAQLVRRNEAAARQAAHHQALLASARAEVDRVLAGFSGGLFTGGAIGGYEVGRLLGRGGMGEVYAATRAGSEVALKVIRADKVGGSTLRRFALEAAALTRIESPYVARVLDVGTEDGRLPYLAMELVHGATLADALRERDRLELGEVRSLVRDAARGLADVHRAGVVHRDVKPNNLVRTTTQWKLVDFGIAVIEDAPRATTGNVLVGTPAYMAPEQLLGSKVDGRSDLYALCLVLYRVIVGRPAFTAQRVTEPNQTPADPYALGEIPVGLCDALRVGLSGPDDRFQTAAELEAAFEAALDGRADEAIAARARTQTARAPWR